MRFTYSLLCSLFLMLGSFTAEATHLLGGDLTYEYVSTNAQGHETYKVRLVIFQRCEYTSQPSSRTIQMRSASCSYSSSASLTLITNKCYDDTLSDDLGIWDCLDIPPGGSSTTGLVLPRRMVYEGNIVLTQTCSDYRFYWYECCRIDGMDNIATPPASGSYQFYFEARLNNRLGPNTSPQFVSTPLSYVCLNGYINFKQSTVEPDGDSIRYNLIAARDYNGTGGTPMPYNIAGGFTPQAPVLSGPTPFSYDAAEGDIFFQPNASQKTVIALEVEEYRYDTVLGFWEEIGVSNREIVVQIDNSCLPKVDQGIKLAVTEPDSLGRQVVNYNCLDSSVMLRFSLAVECFSVSGDGTDFRLTAPNGQPIPIRELQTFCDVNGETDSIRVHLFKPLFLNGEYYLYSKVGTDGNTLLNKCGKGMDEFDTIVLRVEGCVDPEYEVTHVSVEEDKRNRIHFTVDTTKMPLKYIDFMRVYASADSGTTYKAVGNVHMDDSLVLVARDGSPGTEGVDRQYYHYRIQMIAGGQELHFSNDYHTIHLSGDLSNPQNMPLRWSAFAGPSYPFYNDVRFTVQWGPETDSGEYDFRNVNDPIFPMPDSSYTLALPDTTPGNYAIRVLTNQDPNGYISESNWIVYNIPQVVPPPPIGAVPVIIPNAFTPSGDNINDEWTIENIESWSSRKVSIFNRWGRMVWSTDEYNNIQAFDGTDNSGNKLPDGVYMYVVELAHGPTSQSEVHNGTLHLVTNQ